MTRLGVRLRNVFLSGLVVLVPVVLTVLALRWLFEWGDGLLGPLVVRLLNRYIPGLGIVFGVLFVMLVGWLARVYAGRWLFRHLEAAFLRVPVVREVYGTVKAVVDAFSGQHMAQGRVALVEYPRQGVYSVGFVTGAGLPEASARLGEESVCVFIPTTPNPTSGWVAVLPRSRVVFLDLTPQEGMRLVISAGAADLRRRRE
ncbi:MAG: DUF502 domain-containing protein [Bacillota bacterium]